MATLPNTAKVTKTPKVHFLGQLLKEIGDKNKILILALLLEKEELSVGEIQRTLKFTQSKTSNQLKVLKLAGIVTVSEFENFKMHRISKPYLPFVKSLLALVDNLPE